MNRHRRGATHLRVAPRMDFVVKFTAPMLLVALAACSARPPDGPPEPARFQLGPPDRSVGATYYPSPQPSAPTILLLPLPGSSRDAWEPLARQAQRQGYTALAFDIAPERAQGIAGSRNRSAADWLRLFDLVRAAKAEALARGADPANLAIGGAGITANLALQYAQSDPDMQAVVLLSPGLEYEGIAIDQTIRAIGKRPIYIAVTEGDAYAHSSSLQLHTSAEGYCELHVYKGAAHGTDIFSTSANAAEQILLWLKPILVSQPKESRE